MKRKTIKKWTLRTLGIILILTILGIVGFTMYKNALIKHTRGANTELVNPSLFKVHSSPIAIKNVNILSIDCTKILDSLTVLVKNGKIVTIAKDVSITSEYKTIDGTGQYLIPGLVDTHAHLHESKNDLLLYLANGITHISEMFGTELHLKWRKEAEEGALSPKIYVATSKVSSRKGVMVKIGQLLGNIENYTTVEGAQKAVRNYKKQGYDAIKLSSSLKPVIYKALVDEAKKQGIPTVGHLSYDVGLEQFYTSGQSQLAHVEEITKHTMLDFGGLDSSNTEEYLSYLRKNADNIAIKLKEMNMVVASTLFIIESIPKQNFELENFLKTIELEYQNPGQIEGSPRASGWLPGNNSYENMDIKGNLELTNKHKVFWKTYVDALHIMTKALVSNGVTITAGTDTNSCGIVPRFSLHDELESLYKSGMTNSQVLYAATVAPAQWMNSDAGKIEVGSRADLVLLTKNPLENIENTTSINAVITNGKFLDRSVLDRILKSIKEANNRSRKINIDKFIN